MMIRILLFPFIFLLMSCGNTYVTEIRPVMVQPLMVQPYLYQDSLAITTTTTTVEVDTLYP